MKKPLRIVADAHIWGVKQAFSYLSGFDVNLKALEKEAITSQAIHDADILLTRSGTQVNANLLQDSNVRFCGTATIGDDHYDKPWLEAQGIAWASAAGSSTGSVLEYILATLLELHVQQHVDLSRDSIGIVGAGRIGGQLVKICEALGISVLVNDPPRQCMEGDQGFVSLEYLLAHADIVSLHTPLIQQSENRTYHLLDEMALQRFQGKAIINAARGACVDNQALLGWLNQTCGVAVLDCWEHEPDIELALLQHQQCVIATPHIAGHSLDGKAANTQFIYRALCEYLGVQPEWDMHAMLPKLTCVAQEARGWHELHALINQFYIIQNDSKQFKASPKDFVSMRRYYPVRRAWDKQSSHLADILYPDK